MPQPPQRGRRSDDQRAIFKLAGHVMYRTDLTTRRGADRIYTTIQGRNIVCAGTGPSTVCQWEGK